MSTDLRIAQVYCLGLLLWYSVSEHITYSWSLFNSEKFLEVLLAVARKS